MAEKINALVDGWNTNASLNLSSDQDAQLKALFGGAVQKFQGRREAGKQLVEKLAAAIQSDDTAEQEKLLATLREGLRQAAEGREAFLNEFDKTLQPGQRARIVLQLIKRAKETNKPVEQLIDSILINGGDE